MLWLLLVMVSELVSPLTNRSRMNEVSFVLKSVSVLISSLRMHRRARLKVQFVVSY